MNRRQNKKNKNKKASPAAKKNLSGKKPKNVSGAKPHDGAVKAENGSGVEISLVPVCPDPEAGFQPLTHYLAKKLTKLTLHYMQKLCKERGIKLDYQYWEAQIEHILSSPDPKEAIVIPARAGSGKSTAILAFLLALVEILMTEKDMASSLVGAVLVVQKVETLNTIEAAIRKCFPNSPEKAMVALQAWSLSGQQSGYCKNKNGRVSNSVDNVLAGRAFLFLKEKEPKRTFAETSFPYGAGKLCFSATGINSNAQSCCGLVAAFLVNFCMRILKHA